ncbi:MAG: hypothetical protein V1837_06570 [Candidatus Woesearchaeota archaeon]
MKKSQIWVLDVFFALLIFVSVLVLFFKSELNLSNSDDLLFDDMTFESKLVSDSLLSKGFPAGWTAANVIEIGITDDYVINETKLSTLQSMDYTLSKSRLRTKYDYYLFFQGVSGILNVGPNEGVGKPLVNSTNILTREAPHNLVTVSRLVVFRSQPVKMVVYLWD